MIFEEKQTERLTLRKITPEVLNFVHRNFSNDELRIFYGYKSIEETEKEIQKFKIGFRTHNKSLLYFQLIEKESQIIIGWCGFHTWYLDHQRAEIGYGIYNETKRSKGIMTEAIGSVISYGFESMNLNRIEAFIGTENEPSIRLINKFNFCKEGHLKEHYSHNGVIEDSLVFGLLKRDY